MRTDHQDDRRSRAEGGGRLETVVAAAILAICSVIVAGVAWTHPTLAPASVPYTQTGRLSYGAPISPTSVYGTDRLTTGQPIYGAVVSSVAVSYSYRFQSSAPASLKGAEQLVLRISNGEGITRTIPIQPAPITFTGGRFTASGTLHMAALSSAADAFDRAAGIQGGLGTFPVTIGPSVSVHGLLAGQPVAASFGPPVTFSYSAGNLVPGDSSAGAGTQGQADFAPSSTGSLNLPSGKPATLLLGVPVFDARVGSLALLLISLLVVYLAGWPLLRQATSDDERERISARYRSEIVDAEGVLAHAGVVTVQLDSFEGVVQVARRLECPILHWVESGDVYAVLDAGVLYRYRTVPMRRPALRPSGNGYTLVRPEVTAALGSDPKVPGQEEGGGGKRL